MVGILAPTMADLHGHHLRPKALTGRRETLYSHLNLTSGGCTPFVRQNLSKAILGPLMGIRCGVAAFGIAALISGCSWFSLDTPTFHLKAVDGTNTQTELRKETWPQSAKPTASMPQQCQVRPLTSQMLESTFPATARALSALSTSSWPRPAAQGLVSHHTSCRKTTPRKPMLTMVKTPSLTPFSALETQPALRRAWLSLSLVQSRMETISIFTLALNKEPRRLTLSNRSTSSSSNLEPNNGNRSATEEASPQVPFGRVSQEQITQVEGAFPECGHSTA